MDHKESKILWLHVQNFCLLWLVQKIFAAPQDSAACMAEGASLLLTIHSSSGEMIQGFEEYPSYQTS